MAVYVDEIRTWSWALPPFHRGSCHLTADTEAELHELAARIGLHRAWFQPKSRPHYDLTPAGRERALEAGAIFLTAREQILRRRRDKG
ncbi:MAG: DUF4031 domain-containing protein [Polyangiaceae bacterium]|nr:DUF4031 domain-containing protein [Polyangiaceae bacterium]